MRSLEIVKIIKIVRNSKEGARRRSVCHWRIPVHNPAGRATLIPARSRRRYRRNVSAAPNAPLGAGELVAALLLDGLTLGEIWRDLVVEHGQSSADGHVHV